MEKEISMCPKNFEANQNSICKFKKEGCELTLMQTRSTPGVRSRFPIQLKKNQVYYLEAEATTKVPNVFFPWIMCAKTKMRVSYTKHISPENDKCQIIFETGESDELYVGVLGHQNKIGDKCLIKKIFLREVQNDIVSEKEKRKTSQDFYPHQKATIRKIGNYFEITSNQSRSTPGAFTKIKVSPNKTYSAQVEVELSNCSGCFLWARNSETKKEIISKAISFDERCNIQSAYFRVPEGTIEIEIGLLFWRSGLKEDSKALIKQFSIKKITLLNEIVDECYVLNLEGQENKFKQIKFLLGQEGIKVIKWRATNGSEESAFRDWSAYMSKPMNKEDQRLGRKAIQYPGAWGHLLSIKGIFEKALQKKQKRIALFEDDVITIKDFPIKFSDLIDSIEDWDIIYLGVSQWDWTDVIFPDEDKRFYHPSNHTNGCFAVLYSEKAIRTILQKIGKMDSPFDSKIMREAVKKLGTEKCIVAYPNLLIANVNKEGIRKSRDQEKYAKKFGWRLDQYQMSHILWSENPRVLIEKNPQRAHIKKSHIILGVTCCNRPEFLSQFVQSWKATKSDLFSWTLVIADDSNNLETLSLAKEIENEDFKIVFIKNYKGTITRQTNSILAYAEKLYPPFDLLIKCDENIVFQTTSWDLDYFRESRKTPHLVYFSPEWKKPEHEIKKESLVSYVRPISCMGCLYTVTPEVLREVGYFDEQSFKVKGHSHVDFTVRCARHGFNDTNFLFDVKDSWKKIKLQTREDYVRSVNNYSFSDQEVILSPNLKEEREKMIKDEKRKYIAKGFCITP